MRKYYNLKLITFIFILTLSTFYKVEGKEKILNNQRLNLIFKDTNLELAVREVLNKPNGDLTIVDVESITSLDINYKDITSLDGIQNLKNLESLNLRNNKITDIRPLSNLSKLKDLYLSENKISDLSSLKNLSNLEYLSLEGNEIKEIDSLGKLKNLQTLNLTRNNIKYIKGISSAKALKNLSLSFNEIKSLEELSSLNNLTILNLNNNNITSVNPLSTLCNLQILNISYNQISDISSIRNLPELKLTNIDFSCNPLPNYVFEDKLNQEFIFRRLFTYIDSAIRQYYGDGRQYMDEKILNIEKIDGKIRIKVRVTTFVGAHNPPYGIETITFLEDYTGIKVEEFKHEDELIK